MDSPDRGEVRPTELVEGRGHLEQGLVAGASIRGGQVRRRRVSGEDGAAAGQRSHVHQPAVRWFSWPRRGTGPAIEAGELKRRGLGLARQRKPGDANISRKRNTHVLQFPLIAIDPLESNVTTHALMDTEDRPDWVNGSETDGCSRNSNR